MNVELSELVGIVGGWSVILAGLSGWLGKVLSGRILQKENAILSGFLLCNTGLCCGSYGITCLPLYTNAFITNMIKSVAKV